MNNGTCLVGDFLPLEKGQIDALHYLRPLQLEMEAGKTVWALETPTGYLFLVQEEDGNVFLCGGTMLGDSTEGGAWETMLLTARHALGVLDDRLNSRIESDMHYSDIM